MQQPVRLALLGAGNRGQVYAGWCARHPDLARVIAVADPHEQRRERLAADHGLPPTARYPDWAALLDGEPDCDAVIVATPDHLHVDPAMAALKAGYDVLLEKPIAPDTAGLFAVRDAAAAGSGEVTVAHVLRHTKFFQQIRRLLDDGALGRLVAVEHAENVGYWHFAHSYVRGNWRRVDEASPLILAKACHDLDLLRWFADAPCQTVASRGELVHFRVEHAPPGAPERCLDGCPAEDTCPFHAARFYAERLAGCDGPPLSIITDDPSPGARLEALRSGPYGRCVYRCDNDVCDHQMTLLGFSNGVTATVTVSAFTAECTRTVRLFGTAGELAGDLEAGRLLLRRFGAGGITTHERFDLGSGSSLGAFAGHAGGDDELARSFVARIRARRDKVDVTPAGPAPETKPALTSLKEAIDSHLMAFAAERARVEGRVVALSEITDSTAPQPG